MSRGSCRASLISRLHSPHTRTRTGNLELRSRKLRLISLRSKNGSVRRVRRPVQALYLLEDIFLGDKAEHEAKTLEQQDRRIEEEEEVKMEENVEEAVQRIDDWERAWKFG